MNSRVLCLSALIAAAGMALVGCGPRTTVVPGGTVSNDGDTTTVKDYAGNEVKTKTDDGSYEATYKGADGSSATYKMDEDGDFSQTGLTPYPNTFKVEGKTNFSNMESDQGSIITAIAYTKDPADKAADHFRGQLDKVASETKTGEMFMMSGEKDGDQVTIMITKAEEGTQISVTRVKEKK